MGFLVVGFPDEKARYAGPLAGRDPPRPASQRNYLPSVVGASRIPDCGAASTCRMRFER